MENKISITKSIVNHFLDEASDFWSRVIQLFCWVWATSIIVYEFGYAINVTTSQQWLLLVFDGIILLFAAVFAYTSTSDFVMTKDDKILLNMWGIIMIMIFLKLCVHSWSTIIITGFIPGFAYTSVIDSTKTRGKKIFLTSWVLIITITLIASLPSLWNMIILAILIPASLWIYKNIDRIKQKCSIWFHKKSPEISGLLLSKLILTQSLEYVQEIFILKKIKKIKKIITMIKNK